MALQVAERLGSCAVSRPAMHTEPMPIAGSTVIKLRDSDIIHTFDCRLVRASMVSLSDKLLAASWVALSLLSQVSLSRCIS